MKPKQYVSFYHRTKSPRARAYTHTAEVTEQVDINPIFDLYCDGLHHRGFRRVHGPFPEIMSYLFNRMVKFEKDDETIYVVHLVVPQE